MKATITLQIEIADDIEQLYPNFTYNYKDKQEFLQEHIASLNHNIELEQQKFYKKYHPQYDDPNYRVSNDGYKQMVTQIKINKGA
jgi:lipoate synthase